MTPPIVSLVGRPDSGKTTLLEQLLPELRRRGYRIATIKHHVHEFVFDTPGKDTWRHKQAGAHAVILASPAGLGLVRDTDQDPTPTELTARYLDEADLVITEGYKRAGLPKIEVCRRAAHPQPLDQRDDTWIAFVSDMAIDTHLPCFAAEEITALADFLETRFLGKQQRQATRLMADGQAIPLNRFAESFIRRTVQAMTSSLKGCEQARQITLTIDLDQPPE